MKSLALLFLVIIVITSGCTYLDSFFGQDVIQVEETTLEEGVRDVIVINDATTIPKSPILPDQGVVLSFIIENKDERANAENVVAELFDAPLFKSSGGALCNSASKPCQADRCSATDNPLCTLLPGEQNMISFDLIAPSESDLVDLETEIDLNFRVSYDFTASLLYNSFIVSMEEVKARQRAGEAVNIDVIKTPGSGPVQIDVELLGAPYILDGYSGTFLFTVKKVSTKGVVQNSKIGVNNMVIEFPNDIVGSGGTIDGGSKFLCTPTGDVYRCTNAEEIELYSGESTTYRIQVTKADLGGSGIPYKSFSIKAYVDYDYEMRDSLKVKVKPYD
jgi:hypothetical protein